MGQIVSKNNVYEVQFNAGCEPAYSVYDVIGDKHLADCDTVSLAEATAGHDFASVVLPAVQANLAWALRYPKMTGLWSRKSSKSL